MAYVPEMELNLVEFWLRRDPVRWRVGVLGGMIAAVFAVLVAMLISASYGVEIWFPVKVAAAVLLGPEATEYGLLLKPILVGVIAIAALSGFLGFLFAHFVWSNSIPVLLSMGLVWGIFSWIFIWNLFLQSLRQIFSLHLPSALAFVICVAFGLALAVIAPLDRVCRGR